MTVTHLIGGSTRHDERLAELALALCLDAGLAHRYDREPHAVLAEFGIRVAAGTAAPDLLSGAPLALDRFEAIPATGFAMWTWTNQDSDPAESVPAALAA